MTIRLLHVADLQLGKQQYRSSLRTQDFAAVLPQISRIADDERVNLIILGGDVFDSYTPNPFSERAFRKFVEESNTPMLAICGNHEFDKLHQGGGSVSRLEAVTDDLIRPASVGELTLFGDYPIRLAAADWMPASKLPEFLSALPKDLDVLVLHQSCEGFIPNIGATELKLSQLLGKAKLVLLGDLHLCKSLTLEDGTVVSYPGSTELCSSSEPVQKGVSIIDYDMAGHRIEEIRQVPLKTRRVMKLRVFDELGLASADVHLRSSVKDNPLVFLEHNSSMKPLLEQKLGEWSAMGLSLIQTDQLAEVKEEESYVASRDSAEREMEQIIGEGLEDPSEHAAAAALWRTPGAAQEIVEQLEKEIRKSHG